MFVYLVYFGVALCLSSSQVGAPFFIFLKVQLIVRLSSWKEVSVPTLSSFKYALVLVLEVMLLKHTNLPFMSWPLKKSHPCCIIHRLSQEEVPYLDYFWRFKECPKSECHSELSVHSIFINYLFMPCWLEHQKFTSIRQ